MATTTAPLRVLIIGGVAGGAGAAAAARRANERAQIELYEAGEHISFANCGLPYRISGEIDSTERLLVTSVEKMRTRFNVDVHLRHQVLAINRAENSVRVKNLATNQEFDRPYDRLIIATGARAIRPPTPGLQHHRILECRTIADMTALLEHSERQGQRALVIGSGFIGVEVAEAFCKRKLSSVTMLDLAVQILPPWDPEFARAAQQEMARNGVQFKLGTKVDEFVHYDNESLAKLSSGESIPFDVAVLAIGVLPDVSLAKAADLSIGPMNGIQVDEYQRTSDANIFAAGDCTELLYWPTSSPMKLALAGPANKEARVAGANAASPPSTPPSFKFSGAAGTSIVRIFDLTVAMTGLSEKVAAAKGIPYQVIYTQNGHHASYFPGAQPLFIKLVFSSTDGGRILGGQIFGKAGVDKRIDVLATALQARFTVDQMTDLDLAYSPPFGAAKDALILAAEAASNVFHGRVVIVTPAALRKELVSTSPPLLLDVRTPEERTSQGLITANSGFTFAIPIDNLRNELQRIPKDRPMVAFCFVGYRGYLAARILQQEGFSVRNLTGGYRAWQVCEAASNC